jgi:putative restriction endonuclease
VTAGKTRIPCSSLVVSDGCWSNDPAIVDRSTESMEKSVIHRKAPEFIQKSHVRAAARQWDLDGRYLTFRDSTRYDVIVGGKRYPPKAICSIALHHANGAKMQSVEFKGARDGPWQSRLKDLGFDVVPKNTRPSPRKEPHESESSLAKRLKSLLADLKSSAIGGTDRDAVVKTRMFAGKLRKAVLGTFRGRCCLTGVDQAKVLVCSHIVPWSRSTDKQRVDPDNTLLLVASWDALFDQHLISFEDDGRLVVSPLLKTGSTMKRMGLQANARLGSDWLTPGRKAYLKKHRNRTLARLNE